MPILIWCRTFPKPQTCRPYSWTLPGSTPRTCQNHINAGRQQHGANRFTETSQQWPHLIIPTKGPIHMSPANQFINSPHVCGLGPLYFCGEAHTHKNLQRIGGPTFTGQKINANVFGTKLSTTLRVMDVRAEHHGRPRQKVRFPAAPVVGRNFLTPGHPGVRVRNVRGKSGPKSLCLCRFVCDPSRHLQESPGPPGPKSQKRYPKKSKIPKKYPKRSENRYF